MEGYGRAGLGIGQGMVMVRKLIATVGSHGVELMVGQERAELAAGGAAGAVKGVVGIGEVVFFEDSAEAALVEGGVVGYQGQALDEGFHLTPHIGKGRRVFYIEKGEAVHTGVPVGEEVGTGIYEAVELVCDRPAAHHHQAHAAHAAAGGVGGFEVYGCKVGHLWLGAQGREQGDEGSGQLVGARGGAWAAVQTL